MDDGNSDEDRFRLNSQESDEHVAGKQMVAQQRLFSGIYFGEAFLGNREMDVLEEKTDRTPLSACYHIVYNSDDNYLRRTRTCLKYGYLSFWAFHASKKGQAKKRRALKEFKGYTKGAFSLGDYDTVDNELQLGVPLSYQNVDYEITSISGELIPLQIGSRDAELTPELAICSQGWTIEKQEEGYDVGLFEIYGEVYRVFSEDAVGTRYQLRRPHDKNGKWWSKEALIDAVSAGAVKRVGPVDGFRPMNQRFKQ